MKIFRYLAMAAMAACLGLAGCITPKKVLYLQDMTEATQIELENKYEAKISPYDELNIWVSCLDEELAKPFNVMGGAQNQQSSQYGFGYLVDVNGNIQFPVLGEIHAAGMTRLQLQDYIKNALVDGQYLDNPFVNVRFRQYRIFFLGADGGKSIVIPNERCTFLEALALSGDLNTYTKRDKIGVLRNVNGRMVIHYMDPRSTKIFNDPFFLLQQNDFIITESIKSRYYQNEMSYWMSWLSFVSSITSIATLVMVLVL